jgi:LmbE family N-acetylglucosaminyl deacetylase
MIAPIRIGTRDRLTRLASLLFLLLPLFLAAVSGCTDQKATQPAGPAGPDSSVSVLVFAPHPDDETLGFGGFLHDTVRSGGHVKVVVVTDGDAYFDACFFWKNGCPKGNPECDSVPPPDCTPEEMAAFGQARRGESGRALHLLGVPESDLAFLGYPDGRLKTMYLHPDSVVAGNSSINLSATGRSFRGSNLHEDIKTILYKYPRANVYTTHVQDRHRDHSALALYVQTACAAYAAETGSLRQVFWAVIHEPGSTNDLNWPPPVCTWDSDFTQRELRYTPTAILPPPAGMPPADVTFSMSDSLWNPALRTPPLLRQAIDLYKTQMGTGLRDGSVPPPRFYGCMDETGYGLAFVKRNHLFWRAGTVVAAAAAAN